MPKSRLEAMPDVNSANRLAATLNAQELPALAVDILRWCLGHSQIKIMDGPGDGRRDILSLNSRGEKHITQCKYHVRDSAAVSSRETDEIIIALAKFHIKSGTFFTNGGISPQAKREYNDNFPGYELDYIDGKQLLQYIEESPLLSRMWLQGSTIGMTTHKVLVPFIVRDAESDSSIKDILNNESTIQRDWVASDLFEPYRPPSGKADQECISQNNVACATSSSVRRLSLTELPKVVTEIKKDVLTKLESVKLGGVKTVRFSRPALADTTSKSEKDLVWIGGIEPESFVISKSGQAYPEKEWVIPQLSRAWVYPENISVAEVPWSGWYSQEYEGVLMYNLNWPVFGDHPMRCFSEAQHSAVKQSLFVAARDRNTVASIKKLKPHWSQRLGGLHVFGWLHPYLRPDATGEKGSVLVQDGEFIPVHSGSEKFSKQINKLKGALSGLALEAFEADRAIHLAAAAGEPLVEEPPRNDGAPSAQILEYFDELPSPIYQLDRMLSFVQIWELDQNLDDARAKYDDDWGRPDVEGLSIKIDIRRGYSTKKIFVMVNAELSSVGAENATQHFERMIKVIPIINGQIQKTIYSTWATAKLATQRFWQVEVGMSFENGKILGKPWVLCFPPEGSLPEEKPHLYIIRPEPMHGEQSREAT